MHRDLHFGNWMIADKKIYLLDFGGAVYLDNGILDPSDERYLGFMAWFHAPEASTVNPHTFNADVYQLGLWFSEFNHKFCLPD
jgi:hypothetical protein